VSEASAAKAGLIATFDRSYCVIYISLNMKQLTPAIYAQIVPAKSGWSMVFTLKYLLFIHL
jgi:hypothetical protein